MLPRVHLARLVCSFGIEEFHHRHVHTCAQNPAYFFLCSSLLLTKKASGKEEASTFGSWESHRESLRIQYMR